MEVCSRLARSASHLPVQEMKQAGTETVPATRSRSACELLLFRKGAEPEPGLHGRGQLPASRQDHPPAGDGGANGVEPHPDRRHGSQIDGDIEIDVKARIDRAEIDALLGIDDQPPQSAAPPAARDRRTAPRCAASASASCSDCAACPTSGAGHRDAAATAPPRSGADPRSPKASTIGPSSRPAAVN